MRRQPLPGVALRGAVLVRNQLVGAAGARALDDALHVLLDLLRIARLDPPHRRFCLEHLHVPKMREVLRDPSCDAAVAIRAPPGRIGAPHAVHRALVTEPDIAARPTTAQGAVAVLEWADFVNALPFCPWHFAYYVSDKLTHIYIMIFNPL